MSIGKMQFEPKAPKKTASKKAEKKIEAPAPRRSSRGSKPSAAALENIVNTADSSRGRKAAAKEEVEFKAERAKTSSTSERKAKTKATREAKPYEKKGRRQANDGNTDSGPGMFKGYPCRTEDCKGHKAGYKWYDRSLGLPKSMQGTSFYKGATASKRGLGMMRRRGGGRGGSCIECDGKSCKCTSGH